MNGKGKPKVGRKEKDLILYQHVRLAGYNRKYAIRFGIGLTKMISSILLGLKILI
jgi:hypothetical protein